MRIEHTWDARSLIWVISGRDAGGVVLSDRVTKADGVSYGFYCHIGIDHLPELRAMVQELEEQAHAQEIKSAAKGGES